MLKTMHKSDNAELQTKQLLGTGEPMRAEVLYNSRARQDCAKLSLAASNLLSAYLVSAPAVNNI